MAGLDTSSPNYLNQDFNPGFYLLVKGNDYSCDPDWLNRQVDKVKTSALRLKAQKWRNIQTAMDAVGQHLANTLTYCRDANWSGATATAATKQLGQIQVSAHNASLAAGQLAKGLDDLADAFDHCTGASPNGGGTPWYDYLGGVAGVLDAVHRSDTGKSKATAAYRQLIADVNQSIKAMPPGLESNVPGSGSTDRTDLGSLTPPGGPNSGIPTPGGAHPNLGGSPGSAPTPTPITTIPPPAHPPTTVTPTPDPNPTPGSNPTPPWHYTPTPAPTTTSTAPWTGGSGAGGPDGWTAGSGGGGDAAKLAGYGGLGSGTGGGAGLGTGGGGGGGLSGDGLAGGTLPGASTGGLGGTGSLAANGGAPGTGGAGQGGTSGAGRGMMAPGGHGGGREEEDRERSTWLTEDDDVWGADQDSIPGVV